jgi:hypothetical protein
MKFFPALVMLCLAAAPACGRSEALVRGKAALGVPQVPTQLRAPSLGAAGVTTVRLGGVAKSLAAARSADDKRVRVGIARDVALETDGAKASTSLAWIAQPSGAHVTRLSLVSPQAASLRLALRARGLPADAELRVVSPLHPERVLGPVGAQAIDAAMLAAGAYWSPLTEGDEQQVEIWIPATADPRAVHVEIVSASHITVSPSSLMKSTGAGASQSCEQDVVCVARDNAALDRAARSVAKLLYTENGVSYLCSGTLVSDGDASSQVPYLYTAAHCIGSQAAAATLNTFWFFDAASCGGKSADYRQLSGGASLLYANAASDAALVRLNDPAPQGAWFSGWSREPLGAGSALVALHHPAGDVKKLSLGQSVGITPAPGTAGFNTAAWTSGSTEGGSSGSGLFTLEGGEYVLRGGLRGGGASCTSSGHLDDPSNRDYYSRMDQEAAQLGKWLSTAATPLANYGGVWYEPAAPGWGLTIVQNAENHVFATWYGYDPAGRPLWLVMPQATWSGPSTMQGTLYRASGTPYNRSFDAPLAVTPIGSMRVDFAADGTARLDATIDGTSFVRTIERQAY